MEAKMDTKAKPPPLDEIRWCSPAAIQERYGAVHSNTVLFYFSESPFFDPTSNNAIVFSQAMHGSQLGIISTRENFEARLREMSGLEFVVAQEPAESGPGMGTGVWVIRKQTRRKLKGDFIGGVEVPMPDEIEVHADYFVVGENIFKAPTLASVLSSRVATISTAISRIFPAVDSIQKWTPALGHRYKTPTTGPPDPRLRGLASKDPTPMPDSITAAPPKKDMYRSAFSLPDAHMAEESFQLHWAYGTEYMDENPITGKPGDFHLSSTGRKDKQQQLSALNTSAAAAAMPALNAVADASPLSKDGKPEKAGKAGAGGPPKPKRRKSKGGTTPS